MSEYLYLPVGSQPLEFYPKQPQPQQQQPQQQPPQHFEFDFLAYGLDTCAAPSQDVQDFDNDLDTFFAQGTFTDANVPVITDNSALFERIRTGTPTRGAPSTFTVSSESAYDSGYNETESVYTYHSQSDLSAVYEQFNMNFQTLGVVDSDASVYSAPSPVSPHGSPNSNIGMNVAGYSPTSFSHRSSFSDYEPARIRVPPSSASDYYPQMSMPVKYSPMQATVSPANVSASLPNTQGMQSAVVASQQREVKQEHNLSRAPTTKDPKRKYQCPNCPRSFARAFNLKTHVQTHDPNRSKPYACQHKSCGRAFSRKHDLTRHLISIHRTEGDSVGVAHGARTRCEECGASTVANGKMKGCDCQNNVK